MSKQVEADVAVYANNPCKHTYTELLNKYNIIRPKCRICGEDIYYDNIVMYKGARHDIPKLYTGTSYNTVKTIYGETYGLTICEDCMRIMFPEWDTLNKSRVFNRANKYSQYAFNIPEDIVCRKNMELCSRTLDSFVLKYGKEEGEKRWNDYLEKERYTKSFEYRKQKYGETEESFKEYNNSRACTLDNFIKRYGDEGITKWNDYIERQRYTTSLDYFMEKYGEELGRKKYRDFDNARLCLNGYSKASQELFNLVSSIDFVKGNEIYYATRNHEYQIYMNNSLYYLDFYDKTLGLCIEYNGSKFHPNPLVYSEDNLFKPVFEKEAKPVKWYWDKEKKRINDLKLLGIDTIVVWDTDFNGKDIPDFLIDKLNMIKNGI